MSKAAAQLHTAQPALSRQIADLERELGIRLFDRVGRRLILTGAGEQLLGDCRALLESAIPKPSPKLVDLRFTVDLVLSRFYIVLFVGKDRRQQKRPYRSNSISRMGNAIAAVLLLLGLNLLISLFLFLFIYLIKSAAGVDLFPDSHLSDQLQKLR